MGITTTIPTNLNFPNRGILERDAFVNAQETAQDLLAGAYTTALNQYATELNTTEAGINLKAEQVANQAVTGSYSQAYIDATFTPKKLNTQTDKATPIDEDLIPLSDSASSFGLKKLSIVNLITKAKNDIISAFGVLISGLTVKATPSNADMIVIADSASSNASKKLTLSSLKTYVTPVAASETASGIIKLATTAEAQAGTDDARAITPLKLRNALNATGTAPIYACRAWTCFNGTSATITPLAGGNVQSITDNGTGDYTVNFTTAMPDANYVVMGTADREATSTGMFITIESMTISSVRILSRVGNGGNTDSSFVSLGVLR